MMPITENFIERLRGNEFAIIEEDTCYVMDNFDQVFLNEDDAWQKLIDEINDNVYEFPQFQEEEFNVEYLWGNKLRKMMIENRNVQLMFK
ncbi:MAG: hypothetical protein KAX49_07150 [Halanaerobiales bacterium]|nr:hypothetical protein [Halanaerobiales bacterium]